jgi:hypothetical protein
MLDSVARISTRMCAPRKQYYSNRAATIVVGSCSPIRRINLASLLKKIQV